MTERLFRFFQMTANAGFETRYIPTHSVPGFEWLPSQKLQVHNNAGTGPFLVITIQDLLFKSRCSVWAYGGKFLALELEVFRSYLHYLDQCGPGTGLAKIEDLCAGVTVSPVDLANYSKIIGLIQTGLIRPRPGFQSPAQLLQYLGLDQALEIPLHSYAILTSVSNEAAYHLLDRNQQIVEISRPSTEKAGLLFDFTVMAFINVITPDLYVPPAVLYKKSVVSNASLRPYQIDTYTKKTDALSGLVYTHQKVFRNVDLRSLPPTPIRSIYENQSAYLMIRF